MQSDAQDVQIGEVFQSSIKANVQNSSLNSNKHFCSETLSLMSFSDLPTLNKNV